MHLPQDIISDIFSRLPAKSILKFRFCSKSINRFTKDEKFIVKQIQNSTLQQGDHDSHFFIQGGCKIKVFALPDGKEGSSSSPSTAIIPESLLRFLNKRSGRILYSSNGLLFCEFFPRRGLSFWPKEFIICNPATRLFSPVVAVPPSLDWSMAHAYVTMSFDQNQNEYQLLLFEYQKEGESEERVVCKTYIPKEGVWEEREKGSLMGYSWMILCPYFERRFHYMLSYNFEDGETRRVRFPEEVEEILPILYHEDVCTFKRDRGGSCEVYLVIWDPRSFDFTFWVLKDHRWGCWSKFSRMSFQDMGLEKGRDTMVRGFTVINGDSLVFGTRRDIYLCKYDPNSGEIGGNKAHRIGCHNIQYGITFFSYSTTLYSCGPHAKHLAFLL